MTPKKEQIQVTDEMVTNQYFDLQNAHVNDSMFIFLETNNSVYFEGKDYSLSVVTGKTRVSIIDGSALASNFTAGTYLQLQYNF